MYGEEAYGEEAYGEEAYGEEAYGEEAYGEEAYGEEAHGGKAFFLQTFFFTGGKNMNFFPTNPFLLEKKVYLAVKKSNIDIFLSRNFEIWSNECGISLRVNQKTFEKVGNWKNIILKKNRTAKILSIPIPKSLCSSSSWTQSSEFSFYTSDF